MSCTPFSWHCYDRSVFPDPLGQLSRIPIVWRPDENDIQATSCIAAGQWWSTLIVTFRTHVSFHSLVSRVSHCDDATCAATSLRIVVATDEFERAARPCSESRLLFLLSSFLSSFLSSLAGRSSIYLKAHHDY